MVKIQRIKFISIWIFIVPFISVNLCLLLINEFQWIFPNQEDIIHNAFPYFDGQASISRTVRPYPSWLIFKPAMFLTSYLLIKYWLFNKDLVIHFKNGHKHLKKAIFFGVGSAVALTVHSIFLGINFDNDLYKFFRRAVMLIFIIFEITAQAYFVAILYSIKNKLLRHINLKILKIKLILVSLLILVATISLPIITLPGNKFLKHALEWDFFLGVIGFYLLSFFMWKKN
tara:strand:- start:66 stop:752 length:687 start_codon:yes stop_codon:yes gene_type:complete